MKKPQSKHESINWNAWKPFQENFHPFFVRNICVYHISQYIEVESVLFVDFKHLNTHASTKSYLQLSVENISIYENMKKGWRRSGGIGSSTGSSATQKFTWKILIFVWKTLRSVLIVAECEFEDGKTMRMSFCCNGWEFCVSGSCRR